MFDFCCSQFDNFFSRPKKNGPAVRSANSWSHPRSESDLNEIENEEFVLEDAEVIEKFEEMLVSFAVMTKVWIVQFLK
jgi:hypothetical protein